MQIHELNTFSGAPGDGDYLAIDNGTETSKIPANAVGVQVDGDNFQLVSVTAETVFTSAYTGWLSCVLTSDRGISVAPYAALEAYSSSNVNNGVVSAAWGITTSGASVNVSGLVKKGCKYRIHAVRCTIASTRIFV